MKTLCEFYAWLSEETGLLEKRQEWYFDEDEWRVQQRKNGLSTSEDELEKAKAAFLNKGVSGKPEASVDAPFGQFFFASKNPNAPYPYEPNTPLEAELIQALTDYFNTNNKRELDKLAGTILAQKQAGNYKRWFDPKYSQVRTVYRLLVASVEEASRLLGIPSEQLLFSKTGKVGSGVLQPRGYNISGWTITPRALFSVAKEVALRGDVTLVFQANVRAQNNFFLNPTEIHNLITNQFKEQDEVLAYGPVRYETAVYVINNNEEYYKANKYPSHYWSSAGAKNSYNSIRVSDGIKQALTMLGHGPRKLSNKPGRS